MHDKISETYLTPRELAATLRISVTSVYRLVERRDMPFHRFSNRLRFALKDVEEYLDKSRVEMIEKGY